MTLSGYIHPGFAALGAKFDKWYREPEDGGGAIAAYLHGELVVDVWAGYADPRSRRPWTAHTCAMSFSTTKGVASTVLHRLADRGELAYDEPVARYWPEFAAGGKQDITVAQLLSHSGGLHGLRDVVDDAEDLLDHRDVAARLAASTPSREPGSGCGYHGLTYGWLVAGLIEAITGEDVRTVLAKELAEPLGIDEGLWFGAPPERRDDVAHLFPDVLATTGWIERFIEWLDRRSPGAPWAEAFLVPGIGEVMFDETRIHDTAFPSVNGVFTARALARVYGALANHGVVDGVRLFEPETVRTVGRIQRRDRDYILKIPMRWRLGYHQAFVLGRRPTYGFGHFGFGGSGAWADPQSGLSLAFVTNRLGSASTPMGDLRLPSLGRTALKLAGRLAQDAGTRSWG